jgi:phospholipase/carboxylesterase
VSAGDVVAFRERPAARDAAGLLILHHGRGTDESDLLTLADVLDPRRRLHVVTPRAPLRLGESPGYHWYAVPRVGHPDPDTFAAGFTSLAAFHDGLWERTGIAPRRTVVGGFSMGAVMSYALGLSQGRPVPAGIIAFSGFLPEVPGHPLDLPGRHALPVLIVHGSLDQVIDVEFGRAAAARLREAGLEVEYRETESSHHIDPRELPAAAAWLASRLP